MIHHLVREFPPGYGGIERVAHILATEMGGKVFFLNKISLEKDPLQVCYMRFNIRTIKLGRIYLPVFSMPLFNLLCSSEPLIAHLPCPTILFLSCISKVIRPKRFICFYWHSFIAPKNNLFGLLESIYQFLALKLVRNFPVIVTSPSLRDTLVHHKFLDDNIFILPCSLPFNRELNYLKIASKRTLEESLDGTLIVISRLDSYKRIDWLLKSFALTKSATKLIVIGDGPDRNKLESLANSYIRNDQVVRFYGRVEESVKLNLLSNADLLVLPSDSSNEAFGIVQLEAMASGIPSFAYNLPNSGMYWVSKLPSLDWNGSPKQLSYILQQILDNPELYIKACNEAKERYEKVFSFQIWKERFNILLERYVELDFHSCK